MLTELVMHIDVMFLEGEKVLVSATTSIGLIMATYLPEKTSSAIQTAISKQLSEYRAREFIVNTVWADFENSFKQRD